MKYIKLYTVLSLLFLVLIPAFGDYTEPAHYLTYTPGGRALAMGGAFSSIADDSSSTFYNPAGMVQLKGSSGEIYYALLDLDRSYTLLSYAGPMSRDGKLAIGGYLYQYTIGDIIGHDEIAFSTGTFSITSSVMAISVAYKFSKNWATGINFKMLEQDFRENKGDTYGFDFGVLYGVGEKLRASFVLRDISESFSWESGYVEDVPMIYQAGASYAIDKNWTTALEFSKREDYKTNFHFGLQYSMGDLMASLGYSDSLYSLGIGGNFKLSRNNYIGVNLIYKSEKEGFKPQYGFSLSYITK